MSLPLFEHYVQDFVLRALTSLLVPKVLTSSAQDAILGIASDKTTVSVTES